MRTRVCLHWLTSYNYSALHYESNTCEEMHFIGFWKKVAGWAQYERLSSLNLPYLEYTTCIYMLWRNRSKRNFDRDFDLFMPDIPWQWHDGHLNLCDEIVLSLLLSQVQDQVPILVPSQVHDQVPHLFPSQVQYLMLSQAQDQMQSYLPSQIIYRLLSSVPDRYLNEVPRRVLSIVPNPVQLRYLSTLSLLRDMDFWW